MIDTMASPSRSNVTSSLKSLLPNYSTFPPALVNLSESLVMKSRRRAQHLKPEEEIARTYVCCEIACRRLRASLRLPAARSGGAPCKPAVYNKLTSLMEKVLEDDGNNTPITTPRKRDANGQLKSLNNSPAMTPIKIDTAQRPNSFLERLKGSVGRNRAQNEVNKDAPEFAMHYIKRMCRRFETPVMAPHVYAGTCFVLKVTKMWPIAAGSSVNEPEFKLEVSGLIIAVYLMVLTKMQKGKMTIPLFRMVTKESAEYLQLPEDILPQVEQWVKKVNQEDYCRTQEWWENVPDSLFDFKPPKRNAIPGDETEEESIEQEREQSEWESDDGSESGQRIFGRKKKNRDFEDLDEVDPEGVLLPGLGTMMQDAVDWTSEHRKQDFQDWKFDMMKKMKALDNPSKRISKSIAVG